MASQPSISQVRIEGLHGHKTLDVSLNPGLNILHGRNGSGKTTFLHILANLLDADIPRFRHLIFHSVTVKTDVGTIIELRRSNEPPHPITVLVDHDNVAIIGPDEGTPKSLRHILREKLGGRPVYLPAFRAILDAATPGESRYIRYGTEHPDKDEYIRIVRDESKAQEDDDRLSRIRPDRAENVAGKTIYCRDWFGKFVPTVRYPSLREVATELSRELDQAHFQLAVGDRSTLNTVFIDVVRAAVAGPPQSNSPVPDIDTTVKSMNEALEKLEQFQPDFSGAYSDLGNYLGQLEKQSKSHHELSGLAGHVLEIYKTALENLIQTQRMAFRGIRLFEDSVNRFLQGKQLQVQRSSDRSPVGRRRYSGHYIQLENGRRSDFNVLSSGERQVIALLFAATHMSSSDGVVLVDEPELSLHLDWKRIVMSEMIKQAGGRQIIACTHAPEVAAEHRDRLIELDPVPWVQDQDRNAFDSEDGSEADEPT